MVCQMWNKLLKSGIANTIIAITVYTVIALVSVTITFNNTTTLFPLLLVAFGLGIFSVHLTQYFENKYKSLNQKV